MKREVTTCSESETCCKSDDNMCIFGCDVFRQIFVLPIDFARLLSLSWVYVQPTCLVRRNIVQKLAKIGFGDGTSVP